MKEAITTSINNCISYEDFINIALYDKEDGYYMKAKQKIGKSGDFYTSSNVHEIFAKVLTKAFINIVATEDLPPVICEIGAGTGRFAASVINEIKQTNRELYDKLTYIIIEGSPYHLKQQKQLVDMKKVVQYDSLEAAMDAIPKFSGIIFSNELFDAFPVHVVQQKDEELYEVCVGMNDDDELIETIRRSENKQLIDWLQNYHGELNNGQRMEVPIAMTKYVELLSTWLDRSALFTIDYGYTKEEWQQRQHRNGSLRGFSNHTLIDNPLTAPGDIDLTTHIHFDALQAIGEENGLRNIMLLPQDRFLLAAGILSFLQDDFGTDPFSEISKQNRAIRQFISGGGISSAFRVLVQTKDIEDASSWEFVNYEI